MILDNLLEAHDLPHWVRRACTMARRTRRLAHFPSQTIVEFAERGYLVCPRTFLRQTISFFPTRSKMSVRNRMITLSSGFQMPVIGLGTSVSYLSHSCRFSLLIFFSFSTDSLAPDQAEVEKTVKIALEAGYRHIDCAPVYQNEAAVGRGIKASGIPRGDIFVRLPEASKFFYSL
jgi:hypothetical protein